MHCMHCMWRLFKGGLLLQPFQLLQLLIKVDTHVPGYYGAKGVHGCVPLVLLPRAVWTRCVVRRAQRQGPREAFAKSRQADETHQH